MAHITLLAYPYCSMSGISGVIDALAMANLLHGLDRSPEKKPLFDWDIVSLTGDPVQGKNRITITSH